MLGSEDARALEDMKKALITGITGLDGSYYYEVHGHHSPDFND